MEAADEGWTAPAAVRQEEERKFDPIAMIDRLIQDAVAQRLPQLPPPQAGSLVPVRDLAASPRSSAVAESTSIEAAVLSQL